MKVLFVGPTLPGAAAMVGSDVSVRPPARQGDMHRAVEDGANVIGLIDGVFEYVPAIWHKEILHALSLGVHVLGASSMGALRAAECDRFGMVGIGQVYQRFASGEVEDDADVAQLHAPEELSYASLTVPLVNMHATLQTMFVDGVISRQEFADLERAASLVFFKDRTFNAIAEKAAGFGVACRADILQWLETRYIDQKRKDALELLARLETLEDRRGRVPEDWQFNVTTIWTTAFEI